MASAAERIMLELELMNMEYEILLQQQLWKCESTNQTNHSRRSLCHCDVQLHFLGGARQTTAYSTQLHRGYQRRSINRA